MARVNSGVLGTPGGGHLKPGAHAYLQAVAQGSKWLLTSTVWGLVS